MTPPRDHHPRRPAPPRRKPAKSPTFAARTGATATLRDPRWQAVVARDARADGRFVYSVRTTGVYCHPSCASRRARAENVRFHPTPAAAERAGFRACLRCRPGEPPLAQRQAALVTAACRRLERDDAPASLAVLAREAGLSAWHFHRVFKAVTGVTPHAYATAQRHRRLRERLAPGSGALSVTEAIYDAGYNSGARVYETADGVLGMTPASFRAGGTAAHIRFAVGECSLGSILVAATGRGLCAILLGDDPDALLRDLQRRFPKARLEPGDAPFARTVATVVGFVEAPGRGLALPLDVRGTVFQQRVWQALRDVPAGGTASYAEIAQRLGAPRAVRAVAGACAANALAVAIPCHRILRSDGGLSGYRWGVARKRELLARETAGAGPRGAKR